MTFSWRSCKLVHSQQSSTSNTRCQPRPVSRIFIRSRARDGESKSSYLPAADAEQEAEHIALLLLLKFLDVLEGTHLLSQRLAWRALQKWAPDRRHLDRRWLKSWKTAESRCRRRIGRGYAPWLVEEVGRRDVVLAVVVALRRFRKLWVRDVRLALTNETGIRRSGHNLEIDAPGLLLPDLYDCLCQNESLCFLNCDFLE